MVAFNEQTHPPPAEGTVTLAEIDLEMVVLHHSRDDYAIRRYANAGGVCYPHIMLPQDIPSIVESRSTHQEQVDIVQRPSSATSSNTNTHRQPTQNVNTPKIFMDQMEATSLQETISWLFQADAKEMIQALMKKLGLIGWEQWKRQWIDPITALIAPPPSHVTLPTVEWPVTDIAWHPNKQILGIAHRANVIYMYDLHHQVWYPEPLCHPLQRDLVQIVWRPNTAGMLAAVCRQGIALWKFSLQDWHQPKQACRPFMNFLQHPAIDDVSSCSWDPTGQFLAVAGRTDATILVWHVATETVVPLRRVGAGIAKVCWSPDGRYLCAAPNDGDTLRVWDTSNWTNCRAAELATGVTAICWTPDSRHLLFTLRDDNHVYVLQLQPTSHPIEFKLLERPQRLVSFVLSDESGKPIRVGGIIRNIALDPNGERLVVSFEPPPSTRSPTAGASTVGSELIAVFMVRLSNWLGGQRPLLANGFIRGPPAANYRPDTALQITRHPHAVSISFAPHFDRGSLLAIAWDHGKITFVPFFYMSSNRRLLEERMDYRLPEW